ncbi:hypothetical protein COLO4_00284 [Corchorus olitorius]|uniref:Uncharacterized protein n=1 Tax=Corchorus olitorius TaxID=93759 RepID=A0A1R3L478_9ROSI|nr:hypothetical protein COLO4_00284 [Corchorus olitorius]
MVDIFFSEENGIGNISPEARRKLTGISRRLRYCFHVFVPLFHVL